MIPRSSAVFSFPCRGYAAEFVEEIEDECELVGFFRLSFRESQHSETLAFWMQIEGAVRARIEQRCAFGPQPRLIEGERISLSFVLDNHDLAVEAPVKQFLPIV